MLISCSECGHRLRAVTVHKGSFGVVECFDDRAGSDTYRKQVARCPGYGLRRYHGLGSEPGGVARPGWRGTIFAPGAGRG